MNLTPAQRQTLASSAVADPAVPSGVPIGFAGLPIALPTRAVAMRWPRRVHVESNLFRE